MNLESLSREERARLFEELRRRKAGAPAPPASSSTAREGLDLPLSFAQQRLWFLDRLAPGSPVYNVPITVRMTGPLRPEVLAACFSEVVRRHEALRTRFDIRGDQPVQIVEPARPLRVPVIDLAGLPAPARAAEEERLALEEMAAPFDLTRSPMLRVRLVRTGRDEHLLLATQHHIASDAWSGGIVIHEIAALYPPFAAGRPSPLPELPMQYSDYAREQRAALTGEVLEREVGFWRGRLAGAQPLEIPADRPRPPVPSFAGTMHEAEIPAGLTADLRRLARAERATLFMALLAPVAALFARLSASEDVVLGTTVTGRNRRAVEGLVGFFINTLVLRTDLSGGPDGRRLLLRARDTVVGAFGHQEVPFEKLVDELGLPRDPYRPPLLRALLQLHLSGPESELPGFTIVPVRFPRESAKFDLVLNVHEQPEGFVVQWMYDTDLFDPPTIARFSSGLATLLGGWLGEPERRLAELPLLTDGEIRQLLAWDAGETGTSGRACLHRLFEAQAERTPAATAVSCVHESLAYCELDSRANRLARHLMVCGVRPGDIVGLCLDRTLDLVAAVLAVLKAGAAYLPLDPASPPDRLAFALEDSGAALAVSAGEAAQALSGSGVRQVLLDADRLAISGYSDARLEGLDVSADPEQPAYVIYTSGSTGRPKGVVVPHGNVTRLFTATADGFGFGPDDVWTLFHSYAFDFSVWEIWGALLHGGRLVVVPYWESRSPEAFYRLLRDEGVTVLNQTPSAFRQLLWAEEAVLAGAAPSLALCLVIFGGEALDPAALLPWIERHGDERPRLVNMYGITETTVHVTWRTIHREDALVGGRSPVGRALPDLSLRVLSPALQLQPIGVVGEICVGGEGLATGYLGRPDLTAERFVPDPYGSPGARLYRSGDLARRLPDGELEFLGRTDHQVKIRGFRIELGEIEAALATLPGIREAVVLARDGEQDGERRLVAYVTASGAAASSLGAIREALSETLPDYMLPAALVVLDRLPLTVNGKVDRRALPAPETASAPAPAADAVAPRDDLEQFLAGLFRGVLRLPEERVFSVDDDFFELGGNSITGAILINRLQEALGEIVQVVVIFDTSTVASLAAYIREQHPAAASRLWGVAPAAAAPEDQPPGAADLDVMRSLIEAGRTEPPLLAELEPLNPPALFLLSPPRSGSTLLRVMLGSHPRLFAPPELELLSFHRLAERRAAFQGRDSFWLEGAVRAVMEAWRCTAEEAEALLEERERLGWTTRRFYRELQECLGDRMLVDKTPSYALDPAVLRRAEEGFDGARYIHLLRHPQATNRSFEEAKLDQIFFRRPHPFSRRQLAELVWTVSHRNILDFLSGVPAERRHTVRFEDLVRDPGRVLAGICDFLGIDFHPEMAEPYQEGVARMTDGVHAVSRMLGDVKFHSHGRVDPGVAEGWREGGEAPLGEPARETAAVLGYGQTLGVRHSQAEPSVALRRELQEVAPLSLSQERLWFLDRLTPGSAIYNIPGPMRLRGPLDPGLLARCFGEIRRRHETLRTRFETRGGGPVQVIDPPPSTSWPLLSVDLSGLPEPLRRPEAGRVVEKEADEPFDLERGPLLRTVLLRFGPQEHDLLLTLHHIVSDGWSIRVVHRELVALYAAFAAGEPSPLPELPVQYADFAVWQRERLAGPELARQVAYWRERLGGPPPVLDLPLDRPRPALQTFRGAVAHKMLPRDLADGLRRLGLESRASLFMVLIAGFDALLHRWSGQDDVLIGTPVAGRVRPEVEDLIGFFLNTLVLRADLSGRPSFAELVRRVREVAVGAYGHQDVPFEKILAEVQPERDLSRTPLFQVYFNLANFDVKRVPIPGGTVVEPLQVLEIESKFDLTIYATERPEGIALNTVYNADLFDAPRMQELLRQYQLLLERCLADPRIAIDAVPLVTAEAAALLPDPAAPLAADWKGAVHELFLDQARRRPERLAVSDRDGDWTYGELAQAVDRLAGRLQAAGVGRGDRVAVWAHRSAPVAWAVLGALRAGAAFVMLDPTYPPARLLEMLRLAAPRAWVEIAAAGPLPAEIEEHLRERAAAGSLLCRLSLPGGGPVAAADLLAAWPQPRDLPQVGPDDAATVSFTSGSTGLPKGIVGRHGPLSHFLPWQCERFGLTAEDRYSLLSGLAHDPLQRDLFTALCTGAALLVPVAEEVFTPGRLAAWVQRSRITVAHLTPAMAQLLTEPAAGGAPGPALEDLRYVLLVGDVLTRLDVDRIRRLAPHATCVNLYGSTETQRAVGYHVAAEAGAAAERAKQVLPLGKGMQGVQLLVVNPAGHLAGVGELGEIWVRSPHLAQGYLGDEALTADRFRVNPFTGIPGDRIYRTGDLGRYLPDGEVAFAGRADQQVKVRGFRIELGEIEAALGRLPGVREAVVLSRELAPGDRRLIAYVTPEEVPADLRDALRAQLPAYMVPAAFVALPRLPVTPNGKVDRKALARIDPEGQDAGLATAYVEPRSDTERRITALWREVLGVEQVGVRHNFFDLGGHSLLLVRLHARIQEELGTELPLVDLFNHPNIEALARHLESRSAEAAAPAPREEAARDRAQRQIEAARRQKALAQARRSNLERPVDE